MPRAPKAPVAPVAATAPCPNCGRCPTCGHVPLRQFGPYYPWPYYPWYTGPIWTSTPTWTVSTSGYLAPSASTTTTKAYNSFVATVTDAT